MTHLRRTIVIFIIYLTIFYNLERIDFGATNVIDISSFVYIVSFLAGLSVITIPFLWRHNRLVPLSIWLTIYAIGKLLLMQQRPIFGGSFSYLSIAEAALISIAVLLGRELAVDLHDFEEAVRNITLSGVSRRIKSLEQANEEIEIEILRSRRHNRPLAVIVVEPDEKSIQAQLHRAIQEIQQAMMARYIVTSLARVIGNQLRRSDLVIDQHEQGRFIIFSPDTNAQELAILLERVRAATSKQLNINLNLGYASFPEQAFTFDELVRLAEQKLIPQEKALAMTDLIPDQVNGEL